MIHVQRETQGNDPINIQKLGYNGWSIQRYRSQDGIFPAISHYAVVRTDAFDKHDSSGGEM